MAIIDTGRHVNPKASFTDSIIPPSEVRYDQDLIEILPTLEASDFVFVRDEKNAVAGIVTTADVVHAYGELATPFFLIGELDQLLRQLVTRTFTIDEIKQWCDPDGTREMGSFDDLDMGDYQRILENPERWARLRWPPCPSSVTCSNCCADTAAKRSFWQTSDPAV